MTVREAFSGDCLGVFLEKLCRRLFEGIRCGGRLTGLSGGLFWVASGSIEFVCDGLDLQAALSLLSTRLLLLSMAPRLQL